jgi:hypothetical protein
MAAIGRRREADEHENHERWLVSYADFITLLFAFFVVMYALSSINEGKYRVMSDSISSAFRSIPGISPAGQVGVNPGNGQPISIAIPTKRLPPNVKADPTQVAKRERLKNVAKDLNKALAPLVAEGKVTVTEGALGITVDINASVLFAPGDARLDIGAVRGAGRRGADPGADRFSDHRRRTHRQYADQYAAVSLQLGTLRDARLKRRALVHRDRRRWAAPDRDRLCRPAATGRQRHCGMAVSAIAGWR